MPAKPTPEEWLAKARTVNGTAFEFLSAYTEHRKLVSLRCNNCGHIFQRRADVVIKSAADCPRCCNKYYDYERFKDELKALKIDLEGLQEPLEWIGQNTLLRFTCPTHGQVETTAKQMINNEYPCPDCNSITVVTNNA